MTTSKPTTRKATGKKAATTARGRGPQKKPKVDSLKFLAKCYDEADAYASSVDHETAERPFVAMRGETIEGLKLELEDAVWNHGFRAGIEYALTGNETRGLTHLWQWINASLYHKQVDGKVEYLPTEEDEHPSKVGRLVFWRRS